MQLRWSVEAASDLERVTNYLFEETPQHAPELVRAIYKAPSALLTFPHRGRPGKKQNTRELVLSPLPYIVVYRIAGDAVHILRILHGAQKWPPGSSP
jgi:toxin ParE1/3/4